MGSVKGLSAAVVVVLLDRALDTSSKARVKKDENKNGKEYKKHWKRRRRIRGT